MNYIYLFTRISTSKASVSIDSIDNDDIAVHFRSYLLVHHIYSFSGTHEHYFRYSLIKRIFYNIYNIV